MSEEVTALVAAAKAVLAEAEELAKTKGEIAELTKKRAALLADIEQFKADRVRYHTEAADAEVHLVALRHERDVVQGEYANVKAQVARVLKAQDERDRQAAG